MSTLSEIGRRATRKRAAVFMADVVGYTRLLSRAEEETIARVKTLFGRIALPGLAERGGRLVKTTGDGFLAEFPDPVGAVRSAVEIQRRMAEAEADRMEEDRIRGRIGISYGEVVDDAGDLFGEQVSIAARLQKLAAPGGICVSGAVFDRVAGHVDIAFEDAGLQHLRNLDRPVRVFSSGPSAPRGLPRPSAHAAQRTGVAVLPFRPVGGDPDREYLADGIAEELIRALSAFRWFAVTSRSSSFSYRDQPAEPRRVGEELGVRYVVEGSVRWIADRIRVSAFLTETESGRQVWSGHFDHMVADVFALLDELSSEIVAAVEPEVTEAELARALRKPAGQLDAWDLYHRGSWHFHQTNKTDNAEAKTLYRESVELDPGFARGHAGLAYALFNEAVFGYAEDPAAAVAEGMTHARRAVALDPRDPFAHHTLGRLHMLAGNLAASIEELTRALELNPNSALAHYGIGFTLVLAGRPAEAIPHLERACRLSPKDPLLWAFFSVRALGHLLLDNLDEAVAWARRARGLSNAEFWVDFMLAAALGARGDPEAGAVYRAGLARRPDFTLALFDRTFHLVHPEHREHFAAGLARAEDFASSTAA